MQGHGDRAEHRQGRIARIVLILVSFVGVLFPPRAAAQGLTFPNTPVGTPSAPVLVTLTVTAAGTPGQPAALTSGVAGLDFSIASMGTCGAMANPTPGQSCAVTVVFTPRYPGVRQGAVVIDSADGTTPLASATVPLLPELRPYKRDCWRLRSCWTLLLVRRRVGEAS